MALTRDKKEAVIEKIKAAAKEAESLVFVNFHGLAISDEQTMRRALKAQGVEYFVAKKRLARRALEEVGFEGQLPELGGEFALAYGSDPVAPAREINTFAKKHKNALSIVGGVFENRFLAQSEMQEIAEIPPLQTLYAQVVNVINSPIQGLAVAVNAIAEKRAA